LKEIKVLFVKIIDSLRKNVCGVLLRRNIEGALVCSRGNVN